MVRSFAPLPLRTETMDEAKSISLMRKVQHSSTRNPDPNSKRAISEVEPDICAKTAETSPGDNYHRYALVLLNTIEAGHYIEGRFQHILI